MNAGTDPVHSPPGTKLKRAIEFSHIHLFSLNNKSRLKSTFKVNFGVFFLFKEPVEHLKGSMDVAYRQANEAGI